MAKYTTTLQVMAGKDPVWGRSGNQSVFRSISALSPDAMFQEVMRELMSALGLTDPNIITGLLLNLINTFPEEARHNIEVGVHEGLGMSFETDDGALVASLTPRFPKLDDTRPSGLVVASALISEDA